MNSTLKYGLATSAVMALSFLALYLYIGSPEGLTYEKFKQAEQIGFSRYLVLLVGVVAAMFALRRESTGVVTYGAAVKTGIGTALVVAAFVGVLEAAFMALNPGFMEATKGMYEEGLQRSGASAAEIESAKRQMEAWSFMGTPWGAGLFYLFETLLAGMVVALVAGLFVRRPA